MYRKMASLILLPLLAAGCAKSGDIALGGITAIRSACPTVAIAAGTGDITLFNPPQSREARAIDVVANITNLRSTCDETGEYILTNATFDIQAQRRDNRGARQVVLEYYTAVTQGGRNVVSKKLNRVGLNFADGQYRASSSGASNSQVLRSAATLPADIRREITRDRKPGEADAALDPMADPRVRQAVTRASFEMLVGFQMTADQLAYNATK